MKTKRILAALLAALLLLPACALADVTVYASEHPVREDGWYDEMEEVCVYLTAFGELPGNYLTKEEAEALGWRSSRGNLWDVAPGCSIGGGRFGNYEGQLPEKSGRRYTECDIGYDGGYRGAERVVFSNDGLLFYTDDHYESFEAVTVVEDGAAGAIDDDGGLLDELFRMLFE